MRRKPFQIKIFFLFGIHCASIFSCSDTVILIQALKSELEISSSEQVSMFAAILKTWSYVETIALKSRHGVLAAGSPSEWGTGLISQVV